MMVTEDRLRRLRALAHLEGASLLLLVAVGVPLKHLLDAPLAVRVLGPLHGLAFLAYVVAVVDALGTRQIDRRQAAIALGAAMIPGGGFLFARALRAPLTASSPSGGRRSP